jgi:hypothetical protein
MADAKLFVGGTPVEQYPNCDGSREFTEPHARRIAYEYSNGFYTLGWPLNPSEQRYQRVELNAANLTVGDHIMLYAVPELHILTDVLAKVRDGDSFMVGAALKPSAMLYDKSTRAYTEDPVLDTLFTTIAINAESNTYGHLEEPYFVPEGKTLVLSFKVAALPSDATVKLANMTAKVSLVGKVQGFDIPTEV